MLLRLNGANTNCDVFGELTRGLSIGLGNIGECERGEIFEIKLTRCTAGLRICGCCGARLFINDSRIVTDSDGADLPRFEL